jgi:hypothetical protein
LIHGGHCSKISHILLKVYNKSISSTLVTTAAQ